MKKRNLSLFLVLVMILSAFAGTFTIQAEEAAGIFEVNGQFFNDFVAACNAAQPGDTILVHKDYTIPKASDSDPYYWLYDATIEGVQKDDGTYPTLTTNLRYHRIYCMGECTWKNLNFVFQDVIQSSVFLVSNKGKDGSTYSEESRMIMENVNMVLHSTSKSDAEIPGSILRLYHSNTSAHIKDCTVTVPASYANPCGAKSGVFMIFSGVQNATLTLENTTVDASEAGSGICVLYSQESNNKLVIRNSTLNSGPNSEISDPYNLDVEYVGTNVLNGQQIATEDMLGDEIADRKALKEGYVARVGEGKDAIGEDESFPGYYKTVAAAFAAAGDKEVTLIADTIEAAALTVPSITFNGNGRTLTAPNLVKTAEGALRIKDLNLITTADAPMLEIGAASGPVAIEDSTLTSTGATPTAYIVSAADLTVKKSTVAVTHATCAKNIFSISGGADLTLEDVKADTAESAPKLSFIEVLSDADSIIMLTKETAINVGKDGLADTSKGANTLSILDKASLKAKGNAISLPATAGSWNIVLGGTAVLSSMSKTAILAGSAGTKVTVGGTATVTGAVDVINAAGEGVTVTFESGATLTQSAYATNNTVVNLTGKNSKLTSSGTINITTRGSAIEAPGEGATIVINGGSVNGEVVVGSAENAATLIVLAGKIASVKDNVAAITVIKGAAHLLCGSVGGGTMAVDAETDIAYPEGTKELSFNALYENAPTMGDVTLRMNEGSLGMRFTSMIRAEVATYAEILKEAGAVLDYEFGTLITRGTEVRNREMTHAALAAENITAASIKADAGIVRAEDGSVTYTAAIINFTDDNMGSGFVARAYIKYTLASGEILYVYAEEHTESISLGELAQAALADVSAESAEGYRNRVESYYEADEDGWYELISDVAYSPYSKEQQAALATFVEKADL